MLIGLHQSTIYRFLTPFLVLELVHELDMGKIRLKDRVVFAIIE